MIDCQAENRRIATRTDFEQVICNRCGDCCERFWLPQLATITTYLPWSLVDGVQLTTEQHREFKRIGLWLRDAVEPNEDGTYRCNWFRRELDGSGTCTRYADRCFVCRDHPTQVGGWDTVRPTQPHEAAQFAREHPRCSWNVGILAVVKLYEEVVKMEQPRFAA